jgi:hypothetical protein
MRGWRGDGRLGSKLAIGQECEMRVGDGGD